MKKLDEYILQMISRLSFTFLLFRPEHHPYAKLFISIKHVIITIIQCLENWIVTFI